MNGRPVASAASTPLATDLITNGLGADACPPGGPSASRPPAPAASAPADATASCGRTADVSRHGLRPPANGRPVNDLGRADAADATEHSFSTGHTVTGPVEEF